MFLKSNQERHATQYESLNQAGDRDGESCWDVSMKELIMLTMQRDLHAPRYGADGGGGEQNGRKQRKQITKGTRFDLVVVQVTNTPRYSQTSLKLSGPNFCVDLDLSTRTKIKTCARTHQDSWRYKNVLT